MINVTNLSYSVGDFRLHNISLNMADGEYFVLLGKPGSGKSIFLECLCGLNRISSGSIRIAGKDVTRSEPRERGIGYVPQDYALFPTKLVRDNITFGLNVRSMPRKEMEERLENIAELLDIKQLLHRSIHGLSGGEQQKTALARALIVQPEVLLLDEPVSALDEAMREAVCLELKHIQRETGTTTVHVCHNFEETRIVADRVGILRTGELVQVGTPDEIFDHPADANIAGFLRVGNILKGYAETSGEYTQITVGDTVLIAEQMISESPCEVEFTLPIKNISASLDPPNDGFENILTGNIVATFPRGLVTSMVVEMEPHLSITALAPPNLSKMESNTKIHLSFPASAIHIFGQV